MEKTLPDPVTRYCTSCGAEISTGALFCRKCGKKADEAVRESTSAPPPVQDTKKSNPTMKVVMLIVVVLAGFFAYQFVDHLPGGAHPVIADQPLLAASAIPGGGHYEMGSVEATVSGDEIRIPLSTVEKEKIVAFEYSDGMSTVPLLAFISSEGKLVTSYRMCEPCNSRTYSIDGDRLSCGNCETQWSLRNLDGLQGNCQKFPPDPIPSIIRDGMVVISLQIVRAWSTRL